MTPTAKQTAPHITRAPAAGEDPELAAFQTPRLIAEKRGQTALVEALIAAFEATDHEAKQIRDYAAQKRTIDDIPVTDLAEFVKIPDPSADQAASVAESPYDWVEVFWPLELCRNGVEIIDSPGLNEHHTRTKTTRDYLAHIDAVVGERVERSAILIDPELPKKVKRFVAAMKALTRSNSTNAETTRSKSWSTGCWSSRESRSGWKIRWPQP